VLQEIIQDFDIRFLLISVNVRKHFLLFVGVKVGKELGEVA